VKTASANFVVSVVALEPLFFFFPYVRQRPTPLPYQPLNASVSRWLSVGDPMNFQAHGVYTPQPIVPLGGEDILRIVVRARF
jgi:hypothetical protein